jgi:hypothetical protein
MAGGTATMFMQKWDERVKKADVIARIVYNSK